MTALSLRQIYLEDKYFVMHSIGSGHFGDIRVAKNIETHEYFAVKLENNMKESTKLENEYYLYKKLMDNYKLTEKLDKNVESIDEMQYGFPKVYGYGQYENYNYLIMELLGNNLETLFNSCNRKFTLKCVTMIGLQILTRLEVIHSQNIIYRDIKPENFVIGRELSENGKIIYMIDFGLAKDLIYESTKATSRKIIGTSRYMSINAHKGIEQTRKDDLESCAYILIYFLKGSLPWQGIKESVIREKHQKIMTIKSNMKPSKLCKGLPDGFLKFIVYIKLLKSDDIPDYKYLQGVLHENLSAGTETCDWKFDWITKETMMKNSIETLREESIQIESMIKTEEVFCSGNDSSICSCCGNWKAKTKPIK